MCSNHVCLLCDIKLHTIFTNISCVEKVNTYIYVYRFWICIYIYIYIYFFTLQLFKHVYTYMHAYIYIYRQPSISYYICKYVYIYICIQTYLYHLLHIFNVVFSMYLLHVSTQARRPPHTPSEAYGCWKIRFDEMIV